MASISQLKHPQYVANEANWQKYQSTYTGGSAFRETYLKQYSTREDAQDFEDRKGMTYIPAFAKAAVIEIKNAIFNRMGDTKRIDGTPTYQEVVDGSGPGVDREGSSMNAFMGGDVLPELLAMKKVGIFVDRPLLEGEATGTKTDDIGRIPYVYIYGALQIKSWAFDQNKKLTSLLLEATVDVIDEETGLVEDDAIEYRLFQLDESGTSVTVTIYDDADDVKTPAQTFEWAEIPMAIIEIPNSLLEDVADYQISHMNIASSDVAYAWKSNFPFYVEQRDPHADNTHLRRVQHVEGDSDDGTAAKARAAKDQEVRTGVTRGRAYSKGLDSPGFIHPSPEPLKVSMEKQNEMKREIRQLVQLAVTNMDPRRESAESKSLDGRGLEAGLSYIALELERAERQIARIWAMYEAAESTAQIKYPRDYSLRTTADRIEEGEKLTAMAKSSPSLTYQKEMTKLSAEVTLGNRVAHEVLVAIKKEIDDATVVYVDPEVLHSDIEAGVATTDTVSKIRGYPDGEAARAEEEHAARAARIVKAQTAESDQPDNAAARGVKDLDSDAENSPDREKELSQSRDISADGTKGVRG